MPQLKGGSLLRPLVAMGKVASESDNAPPELAGKESSAPWTKTRDECFATDALARQLPARTSARATFDGSKLRSSTPGAGKSGAIGYVVASACVG